MAKFRSEGVSVSNVKLTGKKSQTKRMATSLAETNAHPETRHLNIGGKNYDAFREWYNLPTDEVGGAIQLILQRLDNSNQDDRNRFMRYARLYGNHEALGWSAFSSANRQNSTDNNPVYNVIQSAIDTLNSKIARDNPAPYFITSGADYFDKLKAEKQTQFVQGVFQDCGLYDLANNDVFRDGCVYGLGGLQFELDPMTNKIAADWMFIDELKVDRYDAAKCKPRSMHRTHMTTKEELLARYPLEEQQDKILRLTQQAPHLYKAGDSVVDICIWVESWHLALGDDPGRHVVTFADEVLIDEEYKCDYFPFAFFRWYKKPVGFYGRGVTDEILNGQIEINKILLQIQQCQQLQATPLIMVPTDAEVSEDVLLSNNIARMVKYRGTVQPTFLSPEGCSPEIYQHLQWWITNCYGKVGISQLSAAGQKQPGVNAAIAMRTMVDVESSRFVQVSKNWEQFFVDCAEIVVRLGKVAYERDPSFKVNYVDKKSKILKEIPWKKINMGDDMFVIKCDTVSGFPSTAAGRIQTVTDFISNHYISQERGMELLNIDPDLEDEVRLATSSLRLCEKCLSAMVEDNEYSHPEKYMNLKLALAVSVATYNQLELDGCPDERLELVRNWIEEICGMLGAPDPQMQLLQGLFTPQLPPAPPAPIPVAPQAGLAPAARAA